MRAIIVATLLLAGAACGQTEMTPAPIDNGYVAVNDLDLANDVDRCNDREPHDIRCN